MNWRILSACWVMAIVPSLRAEETGTITGIIDKPGDVTYLAAFDREDDHKDGIKDKKKGYPGRIDANTGRFTIQGLPVGKAYDLFIEAGPVHLEGVNLQVARSDYEEEQPLTDRDRKNLDKIVRSLDKFCDKIEVMAIAGNIQHAAVLMHKLRTEPFYESKPGEIIWRLELWKFVKPDEKWHKSQDELFLTYYRVRLQKADFEKKILILDPALGGIAVTAKAPTADVGKVVVPVGAKPGVTFRKENLKEVVAKEPEKEK